MPHNDNTPLEHRDNPRCDKCEKTMRLVGLEPHGTHPRASLADCGSETKAIVVTQM